MTAVDIANLLKEYGPWGLVAVFALVIAFLYKKVEARQDLYVALLERVISALADGKAGHTANAAALDAMRNTVEQTSDALVAQGREAEKTGGEVRHGIANLQSGQDGIARLLEKLRDAIEARGRQQ